MILVVLFYTLLLQFQTNPTLGTSKDFFLPIYWINLESMSARSDAMISHLKQDLNVKYHLRVTGLTPKTCNLIMVESPCRKVGHADIAIVCSHVNALHIALHDNQPLAKEAEYILVLEDDVRFLWKINFEQLISQAPIGFGSIQLMMSHKRQLEVSYAKYNSSGELFTYRPRNATTWSAQAVLYRKSAISNFLSKAVAVDRFGNKGFKLINTFDYDKLSPHQLNHFKPSIASACLFADMYLYAMAQPSYIMNIPGFNSGSNGLTSTIHQDHVAYHVHGFATIDSIADDLERSNKKPSFFGDRISDFAGKNMSWEQIALRFNKIVPDEAFMVK